MGRKERTIEEKVENWQRLAMIIFTADPGDKVPSAHILVSDAYDHFHELLWKVIQLESQLADRDNNAE